MKEKIREQIVESAELKMKLIQEQGVVEQIEKASREIINAFRSGNKLLVAGNGGSAADAQHIAAEFVNKFNFDRPGLPAIALTTDSSILTSVGNDTSFNTVFSRQISALAKAGDIFIAISTSGKSPNLLEALKEARKQKVFSVGITGGSGGLMKDLCDICIIIPGTDTPRVQEAQLLVEHIICSIVEEELFRKK